MKDIFPHYYGFGNGDIEHIWEESLIVLDTNVLLDLYRVKTSTKDELLNLLALLSERLWIPFQVALEYHSNRLSVIHEQHKIFSDIEGAASGGVKKLFDEISRFNVDKRHATIEIESFKSGMEKALVEFTNKLKKQKEQHLSLESSEDSILDRLEVLLKDKIGLPPKSQKEVDQLEKEFKLGFSQKILPGYKDGSKDGVSKYKNIVMNRKYGDAYVWHQIKQYASEKKSTSIIFVTNDTKEDWIRRIGGKSISTQPHILDDIYTETGVDKFKMYTSQSFLYAAKKYLNLEISDEAVSDVGDVSRANLKEVDIVTLVLNYIEESLNNNVDPDLHGFSDYVGWSEQTVRRRLHELDTNWQKLKTDYKIGRVLNAIEDGEWNIDVLFKLSGYSDISTFYRAFKDHAGYTPGEIIKAVQEGYMN